MSEGSAERVEAAAVAAAAGVAAVEDQQAEEERAAGMEAATSEATLAADSAAQDAQMAAEAAAEATQTAQQAAAEAAAAGDVATSAASEAYSARDDIAALRQEVQQGWQDLRTHLDGMFAKPEHEEPTEVVVTHDGTDHTSERGTDTGGSGGASAAGNTDDRPRRHKFGGRR